MNTLPKSLLNRSVWYRIGVVILLAILFVGFFFIWSEATFREQLAAIESRGEPIAFSQFQKFYTPVAVNGKTRDRWSEIILKADSLKPGTSPEERLSLEELPTHEFFETADANLNLNESWVRIPEVERYLAPREDVLKLCQGFVVVNDPHAAQDYTFGTFMQESMSRLGGNIELRRILWLAMLRDLCQAKPHQAIDRIEQMASIYKSRLEQPTAIEAFMRLGYFSCYCRGMEALCQQENFSDEDLRRCRQLLEPANGFDMRSDLRRTLITERAFGIESFKKELRHPFGGDGNWFATFFERSRFLGMYEGLIEETDRKWPEIALYCNEIDATWTMERTAISAFAIAKSTTEKFLLAEAVQRLADTSLAIRQFANDHQRPPQTLDELAPKYIRYTPLNPITGDSFGYAVFDDGRCVLKADASLILAKPVAARPFREEAEPTPTSIIFKLKVPTQKPQ
ncbi:hypothetical protein K2Y11_13005 [bacterium]|nr:hypothetical protein [bacterium]